MPASLPNRWDNCSAVNEKLLGVDRLHLSLWDIRRETKHDAVCSWTDFTEKRTEREALLPVDNSTTSWDLPNRITWLPGLEGRERTQIFFEYTGHGRLTDERPLRAWGSRAGMQYTPTSAIRDNAEEGGAASRRTGTFRHPLAGLYPLNTYNGTVGRTRWDIDDGPQTIANRHMDRLAMPVAELVGRHLYRRGDIARTGL